MDSPADLAAVARFLQGDEFARGLGIELEELRPGYARTAMTVTAQMVNAHGVPQGGAIFTLADFAFAAACNSHGTTALALSMDIHFLAAAPVGSRLVAEAEEEHLTRRTGLYRMTVTAEDGRRIASLHGMAYRKGEKFLEPKTTDR